MCGFFGIYRGNGLLPADAGYCRSAATLMQHRGPDATGFFADPHCSLAHVRLSIMDLSPQGNQPMVSECGNYALVYNGELYNFHALRAFLRSQGEIFRTNCDTEVVLKALMREGAAALTRFHGMYALALYDLRNGRILLARDHAGMKPLYYRHSGSSLVFGSQFDQILGCPDTGSLCIDQGALALYLSFGYFSFPGTLFGNIQHLPPGSWLTFSPAEGIKTGNHFDWEETPAGGAPGPEELQAALTAAVTRHLLSDAPVGTFLSGGLDSGLVTGLAARLHGPGLPAFTVATPGSENDEAAEAAATARALGLDHHLIDGRQEDIRPLLKDYLRAYAEPFGDYSGLPSMLVARHAREHGIKVLLSGDGADELFFGYARLAQRLRVAPFYRAPWFLRRSLNRLHRIPAGTFRNLTEMTRVMEQGVSDEQLLKYSHRNFSAFEGYFEPENPAPADYDLWLRRNLFRRYFHCMTAKIDRATMIHSVEARIPFVDRDFLDAARRYRAADCHDPVTGAYKKPLRDMFRALFPGIQPQKRKIGFGYPLARHLATDLNGWALAMAKTPTPVSALIDFHPLVEQLRERRIGHPVLAWSLLHLQAWWLLHMEKMDLDSLFTLETPA